MLYGLFAASCGIFPCGTGLNLWRLAVPRVSSCDGLASPVVVWPPSCLAAFGILVPRPGIEPMSLKFFTTGTTWEAPVLLLLFSDFIGEGIEKQKVYIMCPR